MATQIEMAEVRKIRRTLDAQWMSGAVNDELVARLRDRMLVLPHGHRWIDVVEPVAQLTDGMTVSVRTGSQQCKDCGVERTDRRGVLRYDGPYA